VPGLMRRVRMRGVVMMMVTRPVPNLETVMVGTVMGTTRMEVKRMIHPNLRHLLRVQSSSSEDDRPKSLILPWYQVPPRMSHKERKRLCGDLSKIKAYRERFNHPPVIGRGVDNARQREELRMGQEEEKRQQEEQRRQTQLGNRPWNGYTFRRDTAPSPERSPPPSPPGRGQQSRSTLQSRLENSLESNWGFRQNPSPSPPGSRQESLPLSPPPPGFIRCPDCTVNNRDTTTSCGTCGML
jgi:hypothetical protein